MQCRPIAGVRVAPATSAGAANTENRQTSADRAAAASVAAAGSAQPTKRSRTQPPAATRPRTDGNTADRSDGRATGRCVKLRFTAQKGHARKAPENEKCLLPDSIPSNAKMKKIGVPPRARRHESNNPFLATSQQALSQANDARQLWFWAANPRLQTQQTARNQASISDFHVRFYQSQVTFGKDRILLEYNLSELYTEIGAEMASARMQ
jgi:hypothetical protein